MTSSQQVHTRSHKRCEAMVKVRGVWTRCLRSPIHIHHMLTRSRGGLILDAVGETMHLIALCPHHHTVAHGPGGHESGLMIDGYVTTGPDGSPVYEGDHVGLRRKYGPMDMPVVHDEVSSYQLGQRLRGSTQ